MKTIVVGDLHGKVEIAKRILDSPHNVVFVGDYLDSFDRSVVDQIETLQVILDAVENEPNRVTALMGNHELSYIMEGMRCSGYSVATGSHIFHLKNRMFNLLKDYHWVDGILISHAGVSNKLLRSKRATVKDYLDSGEFYEIGRYRGGTAYCGGLFWCDWYGEFDHVPGLTQIVGHSSYRKKGKSGVISKTFNDDPARSYNIDCLDTTQDLILIEDGEVDIVNYYEL